METETRETFDQWATVDVMGHQRYAGRVTETVIAGAGFIRVETPIIVGVDAESGAALLAEEPSLRLIAPGAVHSIAPSPQGAVIADLVREWRYRQPMLRALPLPAVDDADPFDEGVGPDF